MSVKLEDYDNLLEYGHDYLAMEDSDVYKYLEKLSGDFWCCKKLLTYGRPFNFITSERSVGKSTQIGLYLLLIWIKKGKKFIYCRRDKDTIQLTGPKFFDNAVKILNDKMPKLDKNFKQILGFKLEGGKYLYCDTLDEEDKEIWIECGYTVALSLEAKTKSTPFGDLGVYNIVFDEFLERDQSKYLGNATTMEYAEYEAIMSLYETVDRCIGRSYRNETRIFFLGNVGTVYCPLYMTMGLCEYIITGSRFIAPKDKLWLMERVDGVKATDKKAESFAYNLGTERHRKYAFSTDTADDNTFIKKPGVSIYIESVCLEGEIYGIRQDADAVCACYYICDPEESRRIIALDNESHKGMDYQLIKSWKEYPLTKRLADFYKTGRLYFKDGMTKQKFLKYLQFID